MKKAQLESHLLVLVTLALVAFGLVMVYSATSAPAALERTDPMSYLKKQGIYALIGVGLMMTASRFDYRRLRLLAPALVLTALGVLLAVLLISGTPVPTLAAGVGIAATLGLVAIWFEPYRRARLFSFVDPWKDPQGAGFQTVQALISFGSGGFLGAGLGHGVAKINYLPEAHTDMIFAVIGEELGLLGVTAVIAAYAAFAYAGLRVALACKDPFGKRLAAGIVGLVCGQAVINLAAVLGLAPLTGIPLPFISYGGSSLVVALLGVGILLNIAGRHGAAEAKRAVPDRSRRDGGARRAVAGGR